MPKRGSNRKGKRAEEGRSAGRNRTEIRREPGATTEKIRNGAEPSGSKKAEALPSTPIRAVPRLSPPLAGIPRMKRHSFPIVGIGASAGGLDAFQQLFAALPPQTGMAYVVVQHMDPKHGSMLREILARSARIPVMEATDAVMVKPDRIYVIPPNTNLAILHGTLSLMPRPESRGPHMPVDVFLRSLAQDQKEKAIGVVLSGTASDGALGTRAVKAEGGITFAQSEASAKYPGMPAAAIATGCVDFILPPPGIAAELARIGRSPYVSPPKPPDAENKDLDSDEELN